MTYIKLTNQYYSFKRLHASHAGCSSRGYPPPPRLSTLPSLPEVGEGTYGVVYKAQDACGEIYALKTIRLEAEDEGPGPSPPCRGCDTEREGQGVYPRFADTCMRYGLLHLYVVVLSLNIRYTRK